MDSKSSLGLRTRALGGYGSAFKDQQGLRDQGLEVARPAYYEGRGLYPGSTSLM